MHKRTLTGRANTHFLTFSTQGRRRLLDSSACRRIVISYLSKAASERGAHVSAFVVMPDHVHALMWFDDDSVLPEFVKIWKKMSSHYMIKHLREFSPSMVEHLKVRRNGREIVAVWNRRYYDYYLPDAGKAREKINYIHENPVRQGLVSRAEEWTWSSAPWYLHGRSVGVKIEPGFLKLHYTAPAHSY
ncbi:MAG: transposase [bacterium]